METIQFVGDLIIGDQPVILGCGFDGIWHENHYQEIFAGVKNELQNADVNVANFEAVISERPDKPNVNNWAMCCDETIVDVLKKNHIDVVSVANNHSLDYGEEKFYNMVAKLETAGIQVLGKKDKPWVVLEVADKKIAIIGATYLPVFRAKNIPYLLNPTQDDWKNILSEIGAVDRSIAYVHWGSEFVTMPTPKQREIRNDILAAGVDDIIGHHPHILQKNEKIDSHHVFYSLGNFMSDYWQKRLRITQILSLDIEAMEYQVIPCEINKKGIPHAQSGKHAVAYTEEKDWKENSLFFSRLRMRVEYLLHIIRCIPKMKGKKVFMKWLWSRAKYVLANMRKEVKDPEIIYKKYER